MFSSGSASRQTFADSAARSLALPFLLVWLCARLAGGGPSQQIGLALPNGGGLNFLFLDWTWLCIIPVLLCWLVREPSRRSAWTAIVMLTGVQCGAYIVRSLWRHDAGRTNAWDFGIFAQPMWRFAHGGELRSSWFSDLPLASEHGSFLFYLFAPLTRLGSDPATALFVAQAVIVAAWIPIVYLLVRSLGGDRQMACCVATAAAASRAIENAVYYDFHAEAAFPLLFVSTIWAHQRGWRVGLVILALAAGCTREMGAATMAAAMFSVACFDRRQRLLSLGVAAALGVMVGVDMFVLPRTSGWFAYASMHADIPFDVRFSIYATMLRACNMFFLPFADIFSWVAGLPWAVAAFVSYKDAVKGAEYQYSFLWVPPAIVGIGFCVRRWKDRRTFRYLVAAWVLGVVALNASRPISLRKLFAAQELSEVRRAFLEAANIADSNLVVATDSCTSPHLTARHVLLHICPADLEFLAATGRARFIESEQSLGVDRIVIDRACADHPQCSSNQIQKALTRGFMVSASSSRWLALTRSSRQDR